MPAPPKKPRRTAERILEVALEQFNRFGEPNVSTTALAGELNISPGNLYYHYPAKEVLVNALFERYAAEMFDAFGMNLQSPATVDTPRRFVRALFDEELAKHPGVRVVQRPSASGQRARAMAERALALDPRSADAHAAYANLLLDAKRFAEAKVERENAWRMRAATIPDTTATSFRVEREIIGRAQALVELPHPGPRDDRDRRAPAGLKPSGALRDLLAHRARAGPHALVLVDEVGGAAARRYPGWARALTAAHAALACGRRARSNARWM